MYSSGALHYFSLSVGPSTYSTFEIDLRYDTTSNSALTRTYTLANVFDNVSKYYTTTGSETHDSICKYPLSHRITLI